MLVENLRPGDMTGLGFGYDAIREVNPRIVYASASGWGQDGPLAALPGLDIMAQARGGLMSITGTPDGDPAKIGVPICDLVCALYVALGVTAALKERDRSGEGQYLDVSLLEAGVSFAIWEAGKYFATGEVGAPLGSAHQSTAPYQAVRTADGHVTVGAVTPKTWKGLCTALGLEELLDDERYDDASKRHGHRDTLIPAIEAVTATRTTAEVVAALDDGRRALRADRRLRAGLHRRPPEPARLLLGRAAPRRSGRSASSGRRCGCPGRHRARTPPGPQLGAGTRAALEWAGIPAPEVDALIESGIAADPAHPVAPEPPAGSPPQPAD